MIGVRHNVQAPRRYIAYILLCFLMCVTLAACGTMSKSEKSREHYTMIGSVDDLRAVRNDLQGNYLLTSDLDLSDELWEPIGDIDSPFTGVFDGDGHQIKNMTVDISGTSDLPGGLFGIVQNAVVRNVQVENGNVTVSVVGDETISLAGGVVGCADDSLIEQCSYTGKATARCPEGDGFALAAGVVAAAGNTTVQNCYADAEIQAQSNGKLAAVAGVVAASENALTEYCYSAGKLSARASGDGSVCTAGGIVAYGGSLVRHCVVLLSQISLEGEDIRASEIVYEGKGEGNAVSQNLRSNVYLEHSLDVMRISHASSVSSRFYHNLGWDTKRIWTVRNGDLPHLRQS